MRRQKSIFLAFGADIFLCIFLFHKHLLLQDMNKFMQTLFHKMAECIKSFWVIEEPLNEMRKSYKDYPVSPFGPIRLISKETIRDLVK